MNRVHGFMTKRLLIDFYIYTSKKSNKGGGRRKNN